MSLRIVTCAALGTIELCASVNGPPQGDTHITIAIRGTWNKILFRSAGTFWVPVL